MSRLGHQHFLHGEALTNNFYETMPFQRKQIKYLKVTAYIVHLGNFLYIDSQSYKLIDRQNS